MHRCGDLVRIAVDIGQPLGFDLSAEYVTGWARMRTIGQYGMVDGIRSASVGQVKCRVVGLLSDGTPFDVWVAAQDLESGATLVDLEVEDERGVDAAREAYLFGNESEGKHD